MVGIGISLRIDCLFVDFLMAVVEGKKKRTTIVRSVLCLKMCFKTHMGGNE